MSLIIIHHTQRTRKLIDDINIDDLKAIIISNEK